MAKSQHERRYRPVPNLLRSLREAAGLTQRDLAAKIGRSQPWVHKSELGERRVDIAEFLEWCIGCSVNPEDAFRSLIRARR